jgi:diadenosine tetraphosphate (Ap4A) HIT family hydrolase
LKDGIQKYFTNMNNPFSSIPKERILHESTGFYIIKDIYPVSPGHLLIISKRETSDFFTLNELERQELNDVILFAKSLIENEYRPDGFNIGMNCGLVAGQTVFHFHCHVIPRYSGDMENPRGGVRHCILGKGYY